MSIGDISPYRDRIPCRILEYSSMLNNVAAACPARSDDTQKTYIIAIAVKTHEKMFTDPFMYTLHHLVEQKNYKVVVICCMTRVWSELGVDLLIEETFSGISNKKLEGAMISHRKNMNHFLRAFRERLDEKGVQLEIQISIGRRSDDILVKAANELRPHWVVLDISFAGHENKIQAALDCNLVLMKKKKDSRPLVLQVAPEKRDLGPVDHIHDQVSEVVVNPILGTSSPSMRISSSDRITPAISTDLTSRQNGASPTLSTETPLRDHDTGDTATSSTNSKTENGCPAPPALSPAQVATPVHSPLQTERPMESGHLAPPALSWIATQSRLSLRRSPSLSPTQVATKSLPASMRLPAPLLSFRTMATPPNPRNSTSGSKPATLTSSTSRTSTGKATPSISSPLSESIPYEVSLAMAIDASLLSSPPNSAIRSKPATPTSLASCISTGKANPSISRPLNEPMPYETALAMAINASLLPNPPKSTSRSMPATPTPSSSRTWTGEANPSISRPPSEPISYETALAMAINASLLSAKDEGIPVSPSPQHSSSWDAGESNIRPSDGLVPNDILPPTALYSSESEEDVLSSPLIRTGRSNHVSGPEEGAPLISSPLPGNVSYCDEGRGNRGPSDRNSAGKDEFGGWLEGEQTSNSAWEPRSSAGAKVGLSTADIASSSETAKPSPFPTSVLAFSSNQSFTQVASPSTPHAPSAPPLPSDEPIRYFSVDTSPVHYPAVGSSDGPPTKKKANARRDGECVVCWDRPADAVCIPCGHLAGCLSCLTELKSNKWRCPVCRVTIQQVLKIYVV